MCVYVGEEEVIDITMNDRKTKEEKEAPEIKVDTLTTIFSSGKSVASILMAIMVDQGHLNYEDPVVKYWPEFGNKDKSNIKVEDILRHEGGLEKLSSPI